MMNDIDKKSNWMEISTYSVIMKMKYYLKAEQKTSLRKYHCKNTLRDLVNRTLVYNMRTAQALHVKCMEENKKENTKLNVFNPL